LIDSHCHLADEAFAGDLDTVIARARQAGIQKALCILAAGDAAEAARAARLRALWPEAEFGIGIHPHRAAEHGGRVDEALACVRQGIASEGARALGEIGLDYHYDFSPRDVQRHLFGAQLELARALALPVILHTREATEDTFEMLQRDGAGLRGVFHCFTGDRAMARRALDIGFYVSLAGIVTFPRAAELREVARLVPDDRLLVETDAPYLAPVPFRGKRNEPAHVVRVIEAIAELRGVPVTELGAQALRNFEAFIGPNVSHQTA
jgi:TatD DNase family protein